MLSDPNLVLFYVKNPAKSEEFYKNLLNTQPIESSPTFAMFVMKTGLRLGLWAQEEIEPKAHQTGGVWSCPFRSVAMKWSMRYISNGLIKKFLLFNLRHKWILGTHLLVLIPMNIVFVFFV